MMIATPESDNSVLLSIDIATGTVGSSPFPKLVNQLFDVVVFSAIICLFEII